MTNIIHKIKGYLGYKVPIVTAYGIRTNLDCINLNEGNCDWFKLKLRRLDSLTDLELNYIYAMLPKSVERTKGGFINHIIMDSNIEYRLIDYLCQLHIDYQDLIGQGLAVEKK